MLLIGLLDKAKGTKKGESLTIEWIRFCAENGVLFQTGATRQLGLTFLLLQHSQRGLSQYRALDVAFGVSPSGDLKIIFKRRNRCFFKMSIVSRYNFPKKIPIHLLFPHKCINKKNFLCPLGIFTINRTTKMWKGKKKSKEVVKHQMKLLFFLYKMTWNSLSTIVTSHKTKCMLHENLHRFQSNTDQRKYVKIKFHRWKWKKKCWIGTEDTRRVWQSLTNCSF